MYTYTCTHMHEHMFTQATSAQKRVCMGHRCQQSFILMKRDNRSEHPRGRPPLYSFGFGGTPWAAFTGDGNKLLKVLGRNRLLLLPFLGSPNIWGHSLDGGQKATSPKSSTPRSVLAQPRQAAGPTTRHQEMAWRVGRKLANHNLRSGRAS